MSYSKLTAPQKGFHVVMLQNLPVSDLTFMGEDHDVCVSRGERVHFLQEDFPFSVQQSVPLLVLFTIALQTILPPQLDCAEHPGRHWSFVCKKCLLSDWEISNHGYKRTCSISPDFCLTAISCVSVYNSCCVRLAMLCDIFAIIFLENVSYGNYCSEFPYLYH